MTMRGFCALMITLTKLLLRKRVLMNRWRDFIEHLRITSSSTNGLRASDVNYGIDDEYSCQIRP